jgi:2'-5' RNA ligase
VRTIATTRPQRTLSVVPATDPVTAVVVRIALPPGLERLRRLHDPAAAVGVPPHVTLLFPFLPVARLGPDIRRDLAKIARGVAPFEVSFARVGRFPGVVYLVPDPADTFASLTAAIWSKFAEYPPYRGAHSEVLPHLTLADAPNGTLDAIAGESAHWLPFGQQVGALELLAQGADMRWRSRWRVPLGVRR